MKLDPEMVAILSAGLEFMDFRETGSHGEWRRFGKFRTEASGGGIAFYVLPDGSLWHSPLHQTSPAHEEAGKIRDNIFDAGVSWLKDRPDYQGLDRARIDADKALDELMKR